MTRRRARTSVSPAVSGSPMAIRAERAWRWSRRALTVLRPPSRRVAPRSRRSGPEVVDTARSSSFHLRLGPEATDAAVVVAFEQVASTAIAPRRRRVRLERVEPRWFALSAGAAIIGLVLLS